MSENSNARELGLKEAGEKYGKEVESALRAHLELIGKEYLVWLADLYMPRECNCDNFDSDGYRKCLFPRDEKGKCICRGGGFYYSNGARDNDGYEIDIESTAQACFYISNTGMLDNHDRKIINAFPKQMQNDILAFAKSLQYADDGYFYHPQWGKNIIPSRQGRDLGWATGLIKDLGDIPFYDTKNGHKGSLGAPTGVSIEGEDATTAKNTTWIAHLQNLDAFKKYLATFDLKNKSYSSGNNINAQTSQFKERDAQAMANGEAHDYNGDGIADDGFVAAVEEHFNRAQNLQNGLWEDEVHYNSVNGLMKLSSSYNALGLKFNYAKEAFKSAIEIALLPSDVADVKGKKATGSVDVFNPWVAMQSLLTNVNKFGTEEDYNELKKMLEDNLTELIKTTTEKTKKFKKTDGSFGYTWSVSPSVSQMAPVCPSGAIEGDINGGGIATNGIWRNICAVIGIRIPIFAPEDYDTFISRIKERCGYN